MLPLKYTKRIERLLGDEANDYFESFEKNHYSGLRINTLKVNNETFEKISPVQISSIPWTSKGYYYNQLDKPAKHPYYYAGMYYIQEPSAMAPATFLPVNEHDKVLDLCAAPGGKSTELAAKLNGTGVLVTNDISASRAKALLKNIEISGVKNAIVTSEPPFALAKHFGNYFDKILVDAPCSGEGMFRKDPAIIKNWEQYGVEYYSKLQKEIILYAADMLKPGGYMIYSTCTFSPEEDEETIKYLLDNREGFNIEKIDFDFGDHGHIDWIGVFEEEENKNDSDTIIGANNNNDNNNICNNQSYQGIENTKRLWPHKINGEGHFVALLKKRDNVDELQSDVNHVYGNKKDIPQEFIDFLSMVNLEFDFNRFIVNKERIFYIPEFNIDVKGLKVLRNGLLMGEIKTKRFEPSQALASALKACDFENRVNFSKDDENVIRYLKGETIELSDHYYEDGMLKDSLSTRKIKNGWCLITVDGFSLGFAKYNNGVMKNKYLPGWRWM